MTGTDGQSLWDFSVRLYAHAPVKAAALTLQDAGLDVNIAFWIVWSTGQGRDPVPVLGEAVSLACDWHDLAVGPLRQVRDRLKPPPARVSVEAASALRSSVLGAELEAEKIAQTLLEALDAPVDTGGQSWPRRALGALDHYTAHAGAAMQAVKFKEAVFSALKKE